MSWPPWQRDFDELMNGVKPLNALSFVVAVAASALFAGWLIHDCQHPCAKTERYACQWEECDLWVPLDFGSGIMVPTCMSYTTKQGTCERCIERKP